MRHLCLHCLKEVVVPTFAAWPQRCPYCRVAPFGLVSIANETKDGMSQQGPGHGTAVSLIQGRPAGRGSWAIFTVSSGATG